MTDWLYLEGLHYHEASSYGGYPWPSRSHEKTSHLNESSVADRPGVGTAEEMVALLRCRVSQRTRAGRNFSAQRYLDLLIESGPDKRRLYPSAGATHCVLPIWLEARDGRFLQRAVPTANGSRWEELPAALDCADVLMTTALVPGDVRGVFVLAFDLHRLAQRYGERAYRYGLLEAGHLAHCLVLLLAADGVGSCPVGLFEDRVLADSLPKGSGAEALLPLYLVAIP